VSLDTTALGVAASELMDALADAYANDRIGCVAIVVEVRGRDEEGSGFFDAAKRSASRGDPFGS